MYSVSCEDLFSGCMKKYEDVRYRIFQQSPEKFEQESSVWFASHFSGGLQGTHPFFGWNSEIGSAIQPGSYGLSSRLDGANQNQKVVVPKKHSTSLFSSMIQKVLK